MTSSALAFSLAYTVFDDFAHNFDEWLNDTPYWVVAIIVGLLAILFIFSMVKRFIVLAVIAAGAALAVIGFWYYATNFVDLAGSQSVLVPSF